MIFYDSKRSIESASNYKIDMLDEILAGRVSREMITYKDRLSRVGFELFTYLFKKYGCEIIVVSEIGCEKLDSEEVFEEIISVLHCYSMKSYNKRKAKKIKEILEENDSSESGKTSDKTE